MSRSTISIIFLFLSLPLSVISQSNLDKHEGFKPANGVYFVSRNQNIKSGREDLLRSIRATDKKDVQDTTITIHSYGEGWLDKDSIPAGYWEFYARNQDGKEYLLKRGSFTYTRPDMFKILNQDAPEVLHSYTMIQENQSERIGFVKADEWTYYHPGGTVWKQVKYLTMDIPVLAEITLFEGGGSSLSIRVKEPEDEWLTGEVSEFDEQGLLYKKLEFYRMSEVYSKTLYHPDGSIKKTETAIPWETEVSAYNIE